MKDKDHSVSYTPTEYYSMCETSKKRIKQMQEQGIPTRFDPKPTSEEAGQMDLYTIMMIR